MINIIVICLCILFIGLVVSSILYFDVRENEKHFWVFLCGIIVFLAGLIFCLVGHKNKLFVKVSAGEVYIKTVGDGENPFKDVWKCEYIVLDVKGDYVLYNNKTYDKKYSEHKAYFLKDKELKVEDKEK